MVAKEPLDPRRPSGRNADDAEGLGVPCDFCSMVLACCIQARSSFDDPRTGDGCFWESDIRGQYAEKALV